MIERELTDAELLEAAKRAAERRAKDRLAQCAANTLGSAITKAAVDAPVTIQLSPKCASDWCRYRLMTDRERTRGLCDECSSNELRRARRLELQERIPEKFRGASLEHPAAFIPAKDVETAREWLEGSGHLLTIGALRVRVERGQKLAENPTASGKTTLAGMVANSAIAMGKTIEWFDAADLDPVVDAKKAVMTYERILASEFAIIDGYGKELVGAHPDSDIAIRRKGFSAKLPDKIHKCRKGQRFVLTLDLTGEQLSASYGFAEARRIASPRNATVIALTRNDALDVARL
jgi:hypothetical protein